jgi:hypothetical protein
MWATVGTYLPALGRFLPKRLGVLNPARSLKFHPEPVETQSLNPQRPCDVGVSLEIASTYKAR